MSRFRYAVKTYMPQKYTDKNDLMHRVNNTLVTYDGVIYHIQLSNIGAKYIWNLLSPIDGNTLKRIELNDPLLDISAMEVGYYTDFPAKRAFYLIRHPQKRYAQGLSNQNTFRKTISGENSPQWDQFGNHGLLASLYGKFTPLPKAIEMLESGRMKSLALSQDVAIEGTQSGLKMIYVKMSNVGYLTESNRMVIPESKNAWLVHKYVDEVLG